VISSIYFVMFFSDPYMPNQNGQTEREENRGRRKHSVDEGNEARRRKVTRSTPNNYGYFEELLGMVRSIPPQIFSSYRESAGRPLREEKSKSKWQQERRS